MTNEADGLSDVTREALKTMTEHEKRAIEAAAKVFADYGLSVTMPWEATLDDVEDGRFNGLRLACAAYQCKMTESFCEWMTKFYDNSRTDFEWTPERTVLAWEHYKRNIDPHESASAIQEGRTI